MSIFDMPVVVPVYLVALPFIIFMATGAYLIYYYWENTKFCPELSLYKQARKRNLPLLNIISHNGYFKKYLGEKEKKGSIIFKFDANSKEGLRIDPAIQGGAVPKKFGSGGLVEYDYGTSSGFAMDAKTAIAQKTILEYVREKYPFLDVFDGQTILEYCQRPRNYLSHDCKNLAQQVDINLVIPEDELVHLRTHVIDSVSKNIEQSENKLTDDEKADIIEHEYKTAVKQYTIEYRGNYLAKTFMQIQDEVANIPLPAGTFFSYAEAFLNTASAMTAFDLQTLLHLLEQIAEKGKGEQLKWIIGVAFAFAIIVCSLAFAYILLRK